MEKQTRSGRRLRGEVESDTKFVTAEGLGAVNDGAAHGHRAAVDVHGEVQRRLHLELFLGFDGKAFGGDLEKRPGSFEWCAIVEAPGGLDLTHDRVSSERAAQDRLGFRCDDGADAAQPFLNGDACRVGVGLGHSRSNST